MKRILNENNNINIETIFQTFANEGMNKVEKIVPKSLYDSSSFNNSTLSKNEDGIAKKEYIEKVNGIDKEDIKNITPNNNENFASKTTLNKKRNDKRKEFFDTHVITKETIRYLKNLYEKYQENNKNGNKSNLEILLKNFFDSFNILNGNIDDNIINDNTYNKTNGKTNIDESESRWNKEDIQSVKDDEKYIKKYELISNLILYNKIEKDDYQYDSKCILNCLSDKEWEMMKKTMVEKNSSGKPTEVLNTECKKFKKLVGDLECFLFETQVSSYVNKFYNDLRDTVKKRIINAGCKFNNFGESSVFSSFIKNLLMDKPKQNYIDMSRNEGLVYKNVSADKFYMSIPKEKYWNNVALIECHTVDAFNNVVKAVGDIHRNELNLQQKLISTGLETRTLIYTLTPNNLNIDIMKLKLRNGDNFYNKIKENKNINESEIKMFQMIKRRYFIIVTEGLFKKGKLLSKLGNILGNIGKGNSSMSDWYKIK